MDKPTDTDGQTDGHRDSMTDLAQRAESVKRDTPEKQLVAAKPKTL